MIHRTAQAGSGDEPVDLLWGQQIITHEIVVGNSTKESRGSVNVAATLADGAAGLADAEHLANGSDAVEGLLAVGPTEGHSAGEAVVEVDGRAADTLDASGHRELLIVDTADNNGVAAGLMVVYDRNDLDGESFGFGSGKDSQSIASHAGLYLIGADVAGWVEKAWLCKGVSRLGVCGRLFGELRVAGYSVRVRGARQRLVNVAGCC